MNEENMNNEGLENQELQNQTPSVPQINFPRANPLNNFVGHPALGLNRRNNQNNENESEKSEQNSKNSDPNAKNNNDMPGVKKDDSNAKTNNDMPGAKKNDPKNDPAGMPGRKKGDSQDNSGAMPGRKKDDSKKKKDGKNKKENSNIKKPGERKNNNPLSRFNPLNRLGLGRKKESKTEGAAGNIAKGAGNKLTQAFLKLPLVVKIKIVATTSIVLFLAIALFILITILGGTTAAVAASICDTSDSANNYTAYGGSANIQEFLCKSQKPLGKKGYQITSGPGPRWGKTHAGMDLAAPMGTPIYATQSGTVIETNNTCPTHGTIFCSGSTCCGGELGNYVKIQHGDSGIVTIYMHMEKGSVKVSKGDKVAKGQRIGSVGSSGHSSGAHLHYQVNVNGTYTDAVSDYFGEYENFKKQCGSEWDGELAGDSANAKNDDTSDTSSDISSDDDTSSSGSECCESTSGDGTTSTEEYCPNGITVSGVGTLDFEEYVAGVVSHENAYKSEKDPKNNEAMKAQAIAARTYAIKLTDNCSKKIENSTNSQMYSKASKRATKATNETRGSVLLYKNKVFLSQYDSFCVDDSDCPGATCTSTSCTSTYTKIPSKEKHTLVLDKRFIWRTLPGQGHAHGMSQLIANQLQDEGKKYDEILKFFYADGVEITNAKGGSCSIGGDGFSGKIKKYYQNDYSNPYCSGSATIANSGCGPTAMAIVVSSLLGEDHDPVELAEYACKNDYVTSLGTEWVFFGKVAKKYGLKVKEISKDDDNTDKSSDEVIAALNTGKKLVIVSVDKKPFTNGGHFIVLTSYKDGEVFVQDPNKQNKSTTFSFEKVVVPAAKEYFIVSKG